MNAQELYKNCENDLQKLLDQTAIIHAQSFLIAQIGHCQLEAQKIDLDFALQGAALALKAVHEAVLAAQSDLQSTLEQAAWAERDALEAGA